MPLTDSFNVETTLASLILCTTQLLSVTTTHFLATARPKPSSQSARLERRSNCEALALVTSAFQLFKFPALLQSDTRICHSTRM
jgi:hypothetical protein